MNLLITGANGQLGSEMKELAPLFSEFNFFFVDLPEFDITNSEHIDRYIAKNKIESIINCAAYTAVDKAESEQKTAFRVNETGAGNLALSAQKNNCKLLHISTDYVFDGKNYKPYTEKDRPNPQSIYGKSKRAGEQQIIQSGVEALIIRTSWLYSAYGNNFVKTMLRLGKEKKELSVVSDQIGTPTYAADLAKTCLEIITQPFKNSLYHYSNEGVTSWYDFAVEIMKIAKLNCKILPITSKKYPTPAQRPYYSVLSNEKIKNDYQIKIPHWRESLKKCITKINN